MQKNITFASIDIHTSRQWMEQRSRPLLAVLGWELRRRMLSRSSRILLALLFLFSGFITWVQLFDGGVAFDARWPLFDIVQALGDLLWLFLMLVPIIVADAVVRDYKQRVHEIIMTTAVPTWAYVWGRFLAGLCICFLLALPMLVTLLVADLFWNILVGSHPGYLVPDMGTVIVFWAVIILPVMLLVSGLSFGLSTLLPRLSGQAKLIILLGWILVCQGFVSYAGDYAQRMQLARLLASKIPDLSPWLWLLPVYAGLGMVCVGLAAVLFRRFSDVLH